MSTQYNLDETNTQTDGQVPTAPRVPAYAYELVIKEEPEAKDSRAGNPMLVFKVEIVGKLNNDGTVSPTVQMKDEDGEHREYNVAGKEATVWAVFTDRGNPTLAAIHRQAGFPTTFEVDDESKLPLDVSGAPLRYTGVKIKASCNSRESEQLDEDGKPIVDPYTGKSVKFYQTNVSRIFDPTSGL